MHPALKKLSEIEQAATKGPWHFSTKLTDSDPSRYCEPVHAPEYKSPCHCYGKNRQGNGELIAAARNALPALIAALVEIEAKVDNDLLGGSTNNFADGYQAAIRDIHQIINRHLEPLK